MQIRLMPRRLMGQTIRGIRNRLGMSQADFGESLGVDGSTVSKWEKGQTQPEYGTLAKIATMGLVDVLVFHETPDTPSLPQLTPGEAGELREILARMEALLADARVVVDRAANRTAVELLEAATGTPPAPPATADALVLDAEVRLETRPRARSRTASASRASSTRSSSTGGGRASGAKGSGTRAAAKSAEGGSTS
jgi:transcriptional regulator with XRE-family HTH domain